MATIFIDAGANVGQTIKWCFDPKTLGILVDKAYSKPFFNVTDFKGAHLIFIEPDPRCVKRLREKVETICPDCVKTVLPEALGVDDGAIEFFAHPTSTISGTTRPEMKSKRPEEWKSIVVPKIGIEKLLNDYTHKDDYVILKLDVEGDEYAILEKLIETGDWRKLSEIHVEWHDISGLGAGGRKKRIVDFFRLHPEVRFLEWRH